MHREIQALEKNETWVLTTLSPRKKALGCKWAHKIKYQSDGTVERCKAQLVIFGNKQVEGINYKKTFALVSKKITVRVFLVVIAAKQWSLHQMDVHNAFLHGGNSGHLNVLVYVDVLLISGNNHSAIQQFKENLSACFHMKDLVVLKYFLGIEVMRSFEGIILSNKKICAGHNIQS